MYMNLFLCRMFVCRPKADFLLCGRTRCEKIVLQGDTQDKRNNRRLSAHRFYSLLLYPAALEEKKIKRLYSHVVPLVNDSFKYFWMESLPGNICSFHTSDECGSELLRVQLIRDSFTANESTETIPSLKMKQYLNTER